MKKKATLLLILLITITLFYNVVGYYLMCAFEKEQTWVSEMQNIPDSEFKVIQLNATLYSFTEDTNMEYVNENVTINHITYHIFKKRIQNNIINLYYLRNDHQDSTKIKLEKIADSQSYDSTTTSKTPLKKLFKSSLNDYLFDNLYVNKPVFIAQTDVDKFIVGTKDGLHSGYSTLLYTPPKTT